MAPFTCNKCQHEYGEQKQSRVCQTCPHFLCNAFMKDRKWHKCFGCRTKYENPTKVFKRSFNVDFVSTSIMKQRLAVMFTRRRFLAKKAHTKVWWDVENHRIPAKLNRGHYKSISTRGAVDVVVVTSKKKKISAHVLTGLKDD